VYSGTSRPVYTDEPYYGTVKISVENGTIVKVSFTILYSSKHKYFDDKYKKHFERNQEYIMQCRNDWKGIQSYPDSLLKYQYTTKVDVISRATWSFNIFMAAVREALAGAEDNK